MGFKKALNGPIIYQAKSSNTNATLGSSSHNASSSSPTSVMHVTNQKQRATVNLCNEETPKNMTRDSPPNISPPIVELNKLGDPLNTSANLVTPQ